MCANQTLLSFPDFSKIHKSPDYRMSQAQRLGAIIESWTADHLAELGWSVRLMPSWYEPYDLLIDDFLPVEVKVAQPHYQAARPGYYRQRWQFDLSRGLNPNRQDFLYILVALDDAGELFPFVIPSAWTVGRTRTPALTSHPTKYSGWMSHGFNAWHLVEQVYHWRQAYTATAAGQLALPIFT